MSKPLLTEHQLQVQIIQECNLRANQNPVWSRLFAVPNGGDRNVIVAKKLKAEGVRPGVPDLIWPVARGSFVGLVMELKVGSNKPTPSQLDWLNWFSQTGWCVRVVHDDPAEAMQILEWYINGARQ